MRKPWMVGLLLIVAACGPTPSTTDVRGTDVDLALLAGKWVGTYKGTESGRAGVVHFELVAGYGVVEGSVIMNADDPARAQKLKIKFVEAANNTIKGSLLPYLDPTCNCQVETEFLGQRTQDVVVGVFTTKILATGKAQTGRWKVTRTAR